MTVKEKRKKLYEYCNTRTCGGCPLEGPVCRCGRGSSFSPSDRMPENEVLAAYEIVFGGNEMKKFTKKDLKNGDVVKRRSGDVEILVSDLNVFIGDDGSYGEISCINDDLTSTVCSQRDIIAVRRINCICGNPFDAFKFEKGDLIFERKEVEEMTLEEVCKALGKEIKIVKKK